MSKQALISLILLVASIALHLTVTLPAFISHFRGKKESAKETPTPQPQGGTGGSGVSTSAPIASAPAPDSAPGGDPPQAAPAPPKATESPHPIDPRKDSRMSAYAACVAQFLDDITAYKSCLDRHAGRRCWFSGEVMSNQHDSHNCLSLVAGVRAKTYNARVIRRAHDVCYAYLVTIGECLGFAVEMADLSPCFRQEVFARFGLVVRECKVVTNFQEPAGSAMWRVPVADIDSDMRIALTDALWSAVRAGDMGGYRE